MVSAILPALKYLPSWVSRILEDSMEQAHTEESWPIKLLGPDGRKVVWTLCSAMGVCSNGIPGLACRLVERYLAARTKTFISLHGDNGSSEWIEFKEKLSKSMILTTASCVQLAAKMTGTRYMIKAKMVRTILLSKGLVYSQAQIIASEFTIYSYLDFRIGLWNNVQCAEALTYVVGLPQSMVPLVGLLVNTAEYNRFTVEKYVKWTARGYPMCQELTRVNMRTLHLVAGAIVAAAKYTKFAEPDPLAQLAEITRAPQCYLACISNIILTTISCSQPEPKQCLKRKHSPDSNESSMDYSTTE